MHDTKGFALSEINIRWKKNVVECKGRKVAWITETGETEFDSDMKDIAPFVAENINTWKEKWGLE